jgi:hypothetical protein
MKGRRKRASGIRLAVIGVLSFGLTACEALTELDLSNFFAGFEEPAPASSTIEYYDISSSPFLNSARFRTASSDYSSMVGSNQVATISSNIAELVGRSESITVEFNGHADMRCTESTWQRENGPNPKNGGKWCSPRDAYGVTPQGRRIGTERAQTVADAVTTYLNRNYPGVAGSVNFSINGLGEFGHKASAAECTRTPDSTNCLHDRRVDVYVSSRTCSGVCDSVDIPSDPVDSGGGGGGGYTPPPTCLELGTCPADPKPTLDTVRFTGTASSYAQQNTNQSFKFALGAVTCNNGQQAPCGVPTSGEMRTGVSGPHVISSNLSSFAINPPRGYTSPKHYSIAQNPAGTSLSSGATAKVRFFAATRSTAPYTYSATATVTVEWHSWQWDGATMTVTGKSSETVPATLVCSPSKTPACSFGVLGSNTVG